MSKKVYLLYFFILIVTTSCVITGTTSSLRESKKNNCMAPSANFLSLDALHSSKIHLIAWSKKYSKQSISKELNLSDKCRQTKILIRALYGLRDGQNISWENEKNHTSGKIKVLHTHIGKNSFFDGFGGCRDYLSFITIENKVQTYKFRACPDILGWGVLDNSSGFPIPAHLLFAGWYFYDFRFFQ